MTRCSSLVVVLPPWPALVELTTRFIIYALIDPRFNTVRYIGKSSRGLNRPQEHAKLAATRDPRYDLKYCYCWIRSLQRLGLEYEVVVIEELDCGDWLNVHEKWWIAFARAWDCRLTNLTDGGDGVLGYRHTSVTRAKISAVLRGHELTPEHIANLRASMTPERKAKLNAVNMRDEIRQRRRAAIVAAYAKPEVKARHRDASESPSARAKRHAANMRLEVQIQRRAACVAAATQPGKKEKQRAAAIAAYARRAVLATQWGPL